MNTAQRTHAATCRRLLIPPYCCRLHCFSSPLPYRALRRMIHMIIAMLSPLPRPLPPLSSRRCSPLRFRDACNVTTEWRVFFFFADAIADIASDAISSPPRFCRHRVEAPPCRLLRYAAYAAVTFFASHAPYFRRRCFIIDTPYDALPYAACRRHHAIRCHAAISIRRHAVYFSPRFATCRLIAR